MANQTRRDVGSYLDLAGELFMELEAIAVHVREAEAGERHPHFPRPVAWPPEPSATDLAVDRMYADGGGRLSQRELCPELEKLYPERAWNQSAVRGCLRRVARWRALNRMRAMMAADLL